MAEYNEVIKEFKRMCRYYSGEKNECPLYCKGHGCNISHCRMLAFDDAKFQNVITKWVAEHPKPVYPTWIEYLCNIGVLQRGMQMIEVGHILAKTRITEDIAKKLGVEPYTHLKA